MKRREKERKKFYLRILPAALASLFLVPAATLAAEEKSLNDLVDLARSLDTIWVLFCAFLVFAMQAGFALVESGFTRAKNTVNILMKNIIDFSMGSIFYFICGFGIMFGAGTFLGGEYFFLNGIEGYESSIPQYAFFLFQMVFAATAATIVSGAMSERTEFKSYIVFSVILTALVYPIVGHWTWGGGWLGEMGFADFAGSTIVHATGGAAALAGIMILGPRIGKFVNKNGNGKIKTRAIPGHNIPLATLGFFILWLGWFGFNPGSSIAASFENADLISKIAMNTNFSAAAGVLSALFLSWILFKKPDISITINGGLAGLVGITAGCNTVSAFSSVLIGLVSGILVTFSIIALDKAKLDDPVGAIPVHLVCGIWGTIATALFDESGSVSLGTQILGTLAISAFVFVTMLGVFKVIDLVMGLRASKEEELKGLDIAEHGISAYPEYDVLNFE